MTLMKGHFGTKAGKLEKNHPRSEGIMFYDILYQIRYPSKDSCFGGF